MTSDFFDISPAVRLLVVISDQSTRETVSKLINEEGLNYRVAIDGQSALELLNTEDFDLIILDQRLKGLNGIDLCRKLRMQNNQSLVFMISDLNSESDRVLGLEVGADDYLCQPFGNREFVARCRALLRRQIFKSVVFSKFECCDLELFSEECRALRGGQDLKLSPKEFKLLELFIQNPKRVWSRDELLDQVWGIDYIGDKKTVDVHIRWLREKIEIDPSSPAKLSTVRGFGYRFC